ncbi:transglycosylase SLT domain-containing protein [Zobellella sp. An-6]|uniref:transglycosylase SLT domain-containing protein n=1 Tax=Zobellella sp. An-6 TaxID=3400218 RepID=UPI00404288B6
MKVRWQNKGKWLILALASLLAGCAASPPRNPENICAIFEQHKGWHKSANKAREKWGAPVHVTMAMMYQESSFRHDARPPMRYFLFIPYGRASDAYGYAQAKKATWADYQRESGNSWASRSNFDDALDFMGWYMNKSSTINGVSKWDAYGQYLNYHEGWGGYRRGSHRRKAWLLNTSRKVEGRAQRYAEQYWQCKDKLNRGWFG